MLNTPPDSLYLQASPQEVTKHVMFIVDDYIADCDKALLLKSCIQLVQSSQYHPSQYHPSKYRPSQYRLPPNTAAHFKSQ